MTRDELIEGYIDIAIQNLKQTHGRHVFEISDVRNAVLNDLGEFPPDITDEMIGEELLRRWGHGIEPADIGKRAFRFGYGQPPFSREI